MLTFEEVESLLLQGVVVSRLVGLDEGRTCLAFYVLSNSVFDVAQVAHQLVAVVQHLGVLGGEGFEQETIVVSVLELEGNTAGVQLRGVLEGGGLLVLVQLVEDVESLCVLVRGDGGRLESDEVVRQVEGAADLSTYAVA